MKAKKESAYVGLARETIENYVKQGKIITPPLGLPEEMINQKAGIFVSLNFYAYSGKYSPGDYKKCY
jgi:AMMECR1 domain-containing protein